MNFRDLFSPCFLRAHEEPIRVMRGKRYGWECPRCLADLGQPLKAQKFKKRKESKVLKLVKMRKVG